MGRPKAIDPKEKIFSIRVTAEEFDLFLRAAEAHFADTDPDRPHKLGTWGRIVMREAAKHRLG